MYKSLRRLMSTDTTPVMSVKEEKAALRKHIKKVLSELLRKDIEIQSEIVTRKALKLPAYRDARAISVFLSMPGHEISTIEIVLDALRNGKAVFVPYIYAESPGAKSKVMDMLRLQDEADLRSLKSDAWGIPSISAESVGGRGNALGGEGLFDHGSTSFSPTLNLIFMPSMVLDFEHNRLGHGRGFYDRYLTQLKDLSGISDGPASLPLLVGLALREQLLPQGRSVPTSTEDWKVDVVLGPD
ncbi:hypothetical protein LTR66_015399 [Elasticomyces elasticus]|nr:hypothetical protein LTR66_015399 [Elasticomyces elasticus]